MSTGTTLLPFTAADGACGRVQLHRPPDGTLRAALYWLPALGVGLAPNEPLAETLAAEGVAVAIHEWRGLGGSDRRASRRCDWGYRELLDFDLAAGFAAARAALPRVDWDIGGHSLGGQFALLQAARQPETFGRTLLVASGHPHWREFPGAQALGVRAFALALPAITLAVGHFPGRRLGFAGREAARLMRDWAATARDGGYRVPGFGDALEHPLERHSGAVLALRMAEDRLAPAGALRRLRELAPNAEWQQHTLDREHFPTRRPDHFGWMREPGAVARRYLDWRGAESASRSTAAA